MSDTVHRIHSSLAALAMPLDDLVPLDGNPRQGDVDAIMASYEEFGQLRPIVVRPIDDGKFEIVAGNHQHRAAVALGWTHIAAVRYDVDRARGLAFALTDNQTFERGHTDPILLHDALQITYQDYGPIYEQIGWDEFEMAAIEEQYEYHLASQDRTTGYTPAVLRPPGEPYEAPEASVAPVSTRTETGEQRLTAPSTVDPARAATMGATASGSAGSRAVVQYTIVFDNPDQQKRWYDFLRWLRLHVGEPTSTTADRIVTFLEDVVTDF